MSEILITGATGTVGGDLIKIFERENLAAIAATSDVARARGKFADNIELRELDFRRRETFETALRNVRRVFLLFPPNVGNLKKTVFPFVETCRFLGVEQIVLLSVQGAEKSSFLPHRQLEREIERRQIPFTFLRPSYFNQNFLTTHRDEVRFDNRIFVPAGRGQTALVDTRDVAEVAFKAFFDQRHLNRAYELTGDEALNYDEIAAIFTSVLGRRVVYENPSLLKFVWQSWRVKRRKIGFVLVMAILYSSARFGRAAHLSDTLANLLERRPKTFADFVADYRDVWQ